MPLPDHCDSPRLARDALVLGPSAALNRDPTATPGVNNSPKTVPQLCVPQQPSTSQPPSLFSRSGQLQEQGFSVEVAERIAAPQRSTRTIYKSKWALFEKWCRENSVAFSTPSMKQISYFFMYLCQDLNRHPTTIDGYRIAIVDSLGPAGHHIAQSSDLHMLLSSFHRDRPKSSRNLPKWNLSILNELTKALFEPMKDTDLKHLTLKTAFLLALASGKRRSKMLAGGDQCAPRSTITPSKACSAIFTGASKEGWGAHLNERTARRSWSIPESKLHINYLELKGDFLALKELKDLCLGKIVLVATDNTTVVSYINKEGGIRWGPLCALQWRILTWCTKKQVTLKARHIPGQLNVVAVKLSRLSQTIQTEWSLLSEVFQTLCSRWHRPQKDLFATRFNNKLPQFVSPVTDPLATVVDALTLPWDDLDAYAFQPTAILGKVVERLQDSLCKRIILIAPGWPNMPWFWELVAMSSQVRLSLPSLPNLLTQPFNQIPHRNLTNLNLHAWLLEPQQSRNRASRRQWQQELRLLRGDQPDQAKWTIFTKWCLAHQVDFRAPPVKSVADFLMYLFQDRKLHPSTLMVTGLPLLIN